MVAVGFLLVWLGYSVGLEGWCLWKDYDITLGQLMSPFHPYAGPWPPAQIQPDVIWPGGRSASSGSQGISPGQPAPTQLPTPVNGKCPPGYIVSQDGKGCIPPLGPVQAV